VQYPCRALDKGDHCTSVSPGLGQLKFTPLNGASWRPASLAVHRLGACIERNLDHLAGSVTLRSGVF